MPQSEFLPFGGLNQDDSIVVPVTPTQGGLKSPFEVGDYRYALNARIGSSRGDNFGDIENIKGTTQSTAYYATQSSINSNNTFLGSINGWTNSGSSPKVAWAYGSANGYSGAKVTLSAVLLQSKILYQTSAITAGDTISVSYLFGRNLVVSDPSLIVGLYLCFMNGSTEISSVYLDNLNSYGAGISNPGSNKTLSAPVTCTGIGFKVAVGGDFNMSTIQYAFNKFLVQHNFTGLSTPPSGRNKVIGKYEDYEFQQVYAFLWNENNNHTIVRWDALTNTTYELLKWSGLNWKENYFIKAAKLDNWLAFTGKNDNNIAPRLIDVNTISDLYQALGSTNFREFHISHHKWAPVMPPIPRLYYDGTINNYETLKNKAYQFSIQYIYKGKLKSRFSPISKAAVTASCGIQQVGMSFKDKLITSIEVDIPGMILDNPGANTQYNYFDHTDIKFQKAVESIVIAYREGALDLWRIWKTVPVDSSFNRYQYFSGDADNTPIAPEDFDQVFDTVPFEAGTVEAIDNRFVYGDCLNEKEVVTNFDITTPSVNGSDLTGWASSYPNGFSSLSSPQQDDIRRRNSLSQFTFKSRSKYKFCTQFLHHTGWRSLGYTTDAFGATTVGPGSPYQSLAYSFKIPSTSTPPKWAVAYQIMRTNSLNIDSFMYGVVNQFIPILDNIEKTVDRLSIPDRVKDTIKNHFANIDLVNANNVKDEIIASQSDYAAGANPFDRFTTELGVQSQPTTPTGLANSTPGVLDLLKRNPLRGQVGYELYNITLATLIADSSRIMIDVNNWYSASKKNTTADNPTTNKLYYNFREGDRVRFVGSTVANPSSESQTKIFDVPIMLFTGKCIMVERPADCLWVPGSTAFFITDFRIEVYTPKISNASDFTFYEMGEVYPILYPGTDNRDFAKRDWTYTDNASVTSNTYGPFNIFNKIPLFYADCLAYGRTVYRDFINGVFTSVLADDIGISMNPDPAMNYDYWDKYNGRATLTYKDLPPVVPFTTQARFSGKIIERSLVNQLNRFKAEDQVIYPSEYGRIRNIVNTNNAQVESTGTILLMIGEREAWSVYVNRTTLEDLSGRTQVSLSNKVLGSYNALLGSQGTLNPESVCSYNGNVYWWNAIKGSWVRYGRDGLTEISSYKMTNWFREIGNLLITKYLTSELPVVISSYDSFNDELVIYMDHSSLPSTFRGYQYYKGMMFSERDNRWKSAHNYTPEMFARMNNQLMSYKQGSLYLHETSNTYNTFYGVKYDSKIEPVFNKELTSVKHWQFLILLATNQWSVERIISEYRGLDALIQSRIPLDDFEKREDTYWAAIKRNINTANVQNAIIEGDPVRCKAIQVLFNLDPSVNYLSLLHSVFAEYTESPKNP